MTHTASLNMEQTDIEIYKIAKGMYRLDKLLKQVFDGENTRCYTDLYGNLYGAHFSWCAPFHKFHSVV